MPKIAGSLPAKFRQKEIVNYIDRQGSVSINDICQKFGVTYTTVRNDLAQLEKMGEINRTYGGASARTDARAEEGPSVFRRDMEHIKEKQAIAEEALNFIEEGDVIGLDIGSTTYQLAKLLTRFKKLTVVTCDLRIISFLEYNTNVNLIIAGGSVDRYYHCTCGQPTRDMLSQINLMKLFLSSNGLSVNQGVSTTNLEMAGIKSLMMKSAETVYLLCDSSKIGNKAVINFAPLKSIDVLITDSKVNPSFLQQVESMGLNARLVDVPDDSIPRKD